MKHQPMTTTSPFRARHLLCVGSACVDHVLELDELPAGEGKQRAGLSRWGGGGVAATAAVAISRLGARATWCGLVGDDPVGRSVVDMLAAADVAVADKSIVPGGRTAIASVLVNRRGERWIGWYGGDGLDAVANPPQLPDPAGIDAVVADQVYPTLTRDAFLAARAAGRPRVLDAELGLDGDLGEAVRLADHVIFSEEGLARCTGIADVPDALAAAGRQLPDATIAVTLGPRGSAWLTATGVVTVPAFPVEPKDTTGCGDVFHGVYALAVAAGRSVQDAAVLASAAAALKAERGVAWLGMPSWDDVDSLIRKGRL